MTTSNNPLEFLRVRSSKHLEAIVERNINEKNVSHYLIVNDWDDVSKWFANNIPKTSDKDIYIVDIFDVPNTMDTFRSCVKSSKETISTTSLSFTSQLPVMVVLHKSFPRVVEYNGSIAAELGIN